MAMWCNLINLKEKNIYTNGVCNLISWVVIERTFSVILGYSTCLHWGKSLDLVRTTITACNLQDALELGFRNHMVFFASRTRTCLDVTGILRFPIPTLCSSHEGTWDQIIWMLPGHRYVLLQPILQYTFVWFSSQSVCSPHKCVIDKSLGHCHVMS